MNIVIRESACLLVLRMCCNCLQATEYSMKIVIRKSACLVVLRMCYDCLHAAEPEYMYLSTWQSSPPADVLMRTHLSRELQVQGGAKLGRTRGLELTLRSLPGPAVRLPSHSFLNPDWQHKVQRKPVRVSEHLLGHRAKVHGGRLHRNQRKDAGLHTTGKHTFLDQNPEHQHL